MKKNEKEKLMLISSQLMKLREEMLLKEHEIKGLEFTTNDAINWSHRLEALIRGLHYRLESNDYSDIENEIF